ncbi:hypothetical protein [Streptomyces sp. NPDC005538]|uniref:hypothetical protein n=1 Tax=unclassified Streptomyces TaxID=2593676 RepID=UPI0033A49353
MTQSPYSDAPLNDSTMLSFDGRVLEVFGFNDAARYHVWEEPRIEFRTGRSHKLTITTKAGRSHTMYYDAHRLPDLQALAERLERSRPGGAQH